MNTHVFSSLDVCDLVVGHSYSGGSSGNAGDDPISRLLPGTGNQGGIRVSGRQEHRRLIALYTTGKDPDWVDLLDDSNGQLTYFGDNKDPDKDLHETKGNQALRDIFRLLMQGDRTQIPPFFLFHLHPLPGSSRAVRFGGIAAPGWIGRASTKSLDAVWQAKAGRYFQNYRACLTVLDDRLITRGWIRSIVAGTPDDALAPAAWKVWRGTGAYHPLLSAASGEDA